NVETKPGIGYPKDWENQERWKGGWRRKKNGKLVPRQGGRLAVLANIFANPYLPEIDDYYEPFTFDYENLHTAPELETAPVARRSSPPTPTCRKSTITTNHSPSTTKPCTPHRSWRRRRSPGQSRWCRGAPWKRSNGGPTGKRSWAANSKSASRITTSRTCKRIFTGSSKRPS